MAPKAPKIPKKKKRDKNIKDASAMDVITTVAPHLQDIINYGVHGTAALGAGALGYVPYKLKQIDKKSRGKKAGGTIKLRGGGLARRKRNA